MDHDDGTLPFRNKYLDGSPKQITHIFLVFILSSKLLAVLLLTYEKSGQK